MARTLRDLMDQQSAGALVGREHELRAFAAALEGPGPPVVWVHGLGGVGKSTLLTAFAAAARAAGATVVTLDCRAIEPTARGFLTELTSAIGGDGAGPGEAAKRLSSLDERVVLMLDGYEVFRLGDDWLRHHFVPAISDNVRIVIAGRDRPNAGWTATAGWSELLCTIPLGPLPEAEAELVLERAGVDPVQAKRINRVLRGHPLALRVAATTIADRPGRSLDDVTMPLVIEELTRLYVDDLDRSTREVLEAASVVRRTTMPLLAAMLPDRAPNDAFDRLRALDFVETSRDGLRVHDMLREAIASSLRSADPSKFQRLRRAAWTEVKNEAARAAPGDLWRFTADMLYLVENPAVREAFFPSDASPVALETARPDDAGALHEIFDAHETEAGAALLRAWWESAPETFRVARDADGDVAGFHILADPSETEALPADPVIDEWRDHLRTEPMAAHQRCLFSRRWLDRRVGEDPSAVQAACWLDIKRVYMELRPNLRRVYAATDNPAPYVDVLLQLGFELFDTPVDVGGRPFFLAVLDFGPASVDGWLAGLAGAALGLDDLDDDVLDVDARELVLDGQRIALTPMEFEVFRYLHRRPAKAVKRIDLLEHVWGFDVAGGSNVVDAVVRTLRKKLGDHREMIETVRGVGYRYRRATEAITSR